MLPLLFPPQVNELAVDFMRDTMPIAANNLNREQLFWVLPRQMDKFELEFVKSCINEADRNTKMDAIFEHNKLFGHQLNGDPYPAPAAPAEAPALTFILDGHKYCTTADGNYLYLETSA
jgi:hypothetical protein